MLDPLMHLLEPLIQMCMLISLVCIPMTEFGGIGPSELANGRYVDGASELVMVLDGDVVIAANQASSNLAKDIYNQHQKDFAEQLGSSHGVGSS
uniref:Uncharacterized protein n=1 Tax=Tanacetum cinerariifolium TaxID=118510 RepID=A0A699IVJ6_TANCI|nr:hypothetical protein [Tanacetum cinerariifolium]